jgi:hypothetical protein
MAVLWTKQSFQGDVKIGRGYIRLEPGPEWVAMLYLGATGSGVGPYEWRRAP